MKEYEMISRMVKRDPANTSTIKVLGFVVTYANSLGKSNKIRATINNIKSEKKVAGKIVPGYFFPGKLPLLVTVVSGISLEDNVIRVVSRAITEKQLELYADTNHPNVVTMEEQKEIKPVTSHDIVVVSPSGKEAIDNTPLGDIANKYQYTADLSLVYYNIDNEKHISTKGFFSMVVCIEHRDTINILLEVLASTPASRLATIGNTPTALYSLEAIYNVCRAQAH